MSARFRKRALDDLEDISKYLTPRSPSGAANVLRAIDRAIAEISDRPLAARQTSDETVRVKIVGHYRYQIFYSIEADGIEILHIRHGARRPWVVLPPT